MPVSSDQEASYSEIRERDVGAIGKHCDVAACHQLDFLPFKCESCKGTYCLDHRTETAHKCAHEGKWAAERRARELARSAGGSSSSSSSSSSPSTTGGQKLGSRLTDVATQCRRDGCKTMVNTPRSTGVHCATCRRTYCIAHRLPESHACSTLAPVPGSSAAMAQAQTAQAADKARAAFARFKAWTASKQEKVGERVAVRRPGGSAAVELMKLKKAATGDQKIPLEKRVYVHVEAEKSSTTSRLPRGEFFYSADWSVGKVLDRAAADLSVANLNNRVDDDETRLRVFHVEGGRMLSFSEKFGDAVASGNSIVLLRGVMMPELIEL